MQTNYNSEMSIGIEGSIADSGKIDAQSAIIEGAGVTSFGVAVTKGSSDEQVKALSATTEKVRGLVLHQNVADGVIAAGLAVSILRKGRAFVKVEEAVVKGDPVFVRAVATGGEIAGAFRKSQDGTDCIAVTNAEFASSAAAGALAIVDLNLP